MDEVILDQSEVRERIAEQVEDPPGVHRALLWVHGESAAGLLWLDPGTSLGPHTHRGHAHHVWVAEGTALVSGRELHAGSYAFVPPGRAHTLEGGPDGCRMFYLYLEV